MAYSSLEDCLLDLENTGQLVRIKEEVDPNLQMAAIHLRVFEASGPALLFENVKGFTMEFKKNKDKGKEYSSYVENALNRAGYFVKGELVNFGEYELTQVGLVAIELFK
jgi:DNA (cytosine-5)-methyltransferase 1